MFLFLTSSFFTCDAENGLNFMFFSFVINNLLHSLHHLVFARIKASCDRLFGSTNGTRSGVSEKSIFQFEVAVEVDPNLETLTLLLKPQSAVFFGKSCL